MSVEPGQDELPAPTDTSSNGGRDVDPVADGDGPGVQTPLPPPDEDDGYEPV